MSRVSRVKYATELAENFSRVQEALPTGRPYTDSRTKETSREAGPDLLTNRDQGENLEHETGLEPATATLASPSGETDEQ